MFSVALRSENHICLANEDMLAVRDYVLESTQASKTTTKTVRRCQNGNFASQKCDLIPTG